MLLIERFCGLDSRAGWSTVEPLLLSAGDDEDPVTDCCCKAKERSSITVESMLSKSVYRSSPQYYIKLLYITHLQLGY